MTAFVFCNLLLAVVEISRSPIQTWLTGDLASGLGIAAMIVSLLLGRLKKVRGQLWHDGFLTGAMLTWYASWKPQFETDAPMFVFYPLYFSLISAVVSLLLVNRASNFDPESVRQLRYMDKLARFDFSFNVGFVVVALVITRHYALFPMAVTFYIMREAIIACLDRIDGRD